MRERDKLEAWLKAEMGAKETEPSSVSVHEPTGDEAHRLEAWMRGMRDPRSTTTASRRLRQRSGATTAARSSENAAQLEAWLSVGMRAPALPSADQAHRPPRDPRVIPLVDTHRAPATTAQPESSSPPVRTTGATSDKTCDLSPQAYANIKLAIWSGSKTVDAASREHGIKESTFREYDARQADRRASQLEDPNDEEIALHRDALRKARGATSAASEPPPMTAKAYATLRVELDIAEDEEAVLHRMGLDTATWRDRRIAFRRAMRRNPKLRRAFRSALKKAKQRHETNEDPPS